MFLLDATFGVTDGLDREFAFGMAQKYLNGVSSLTAPRPEPGHEKEAKTEDGKVSAWVGDYDNAFAFVVTENSDDGSLKTSVVLRDKDESPSMHFRQDFRSKSLRLDDADKSLQVVPDVLHEVFWNDFGAEDFGIPFTNTPIAITKRNAEKAAELLIGDESKGYPKAPVVYVGLNALDYEYVATELAGQAHVLYVANPVAEAEVYRLLRDAGKEDCIPESGAVTVLVPGDGCSSIGTDSIPEDKKMAAEHIIRIVRRVIENAGVSEIYNIGTLQYQHLRGSVGDGSELSELFDRLLAASEAEKDALQKELSATREQLRQAVLKADSLTKGLEKTEQQKGGKFITLEVTEADLYDGETKDVVLKALEQARGMMGGDNTLQTSRKYHVLTDVLEHNFPCHTDTELTECLRGAFVDGSLTRDGIGRLRAAGFTVEKEDRSGHYKIRLGNDDRYMGIYASTPSDKRRCVNNFISDFTNLLFGY